MAKVLWADTETTGVNAFKNGVIQIAGMVEIDGDIKESFNFQAAPFENDVIDDKALEVNRTTVSEIRKYPKPEITYGQLVTIMGKYVNKFNKKDKFILAGYNTQFDAEMMRMFFKKNGDNYFYSYVFGGKIDVMANIMTYCHISNTAMVDHKLATACGHFGISAEFHDALDDIKATRQLYHAVLEKQHEFLGRKFD